MPTTIPIALVELRTRQTPALFLVALVALITAAFVVEIIDPSPLDAAAAAITAP